MNITWQTAVRYSPASCLAHQRLSTGAGPHTEAALGRISADYHGISRANSLTSLSDSCWHLIELLDPSFILVYCQHNRWQADEASPKNKKMNGKTRCYYLCAFGWRSQASKSRGKFWVKAHVFQAPDLNSLSLLLYAACHYRSHCTRRGRNNHFQMQLQVA